MPPHVTKELHAAKEPHAVSHVSECRKKATLLQFNNTTTLDIDTGREI